MTQLDRKRLNDNFLDRQDDHGRRLRRMARSAVAANSAAQIPAAGLLLRVVEAEPAAPASGYVLLFAQLVSDDIYLRAMDAEGTVIELGDWA